MATYSVWYKKLPLEVIHAKAAKYSLDPDLVAAICQHETLGVNAKTRFEKGTPDKYLQFYRVWAEKLQISQETEKLAQMHSHGLMQVMGYNFRHYGFDSYLSKVASDPEIAIEYGCKHLRYLKTRFHEEEEVVSAYNFGHVAKTPGGLFLNQKNYVDQVYKYLRELRSLR